MKNSSERKKDNLEWLGEFYFRLCDGDWEHSYGVELDTLDNPGWDLKVDLIDTVLEHTHFNSVSDLRTDNDWVIYQKNSHQFIASGGPNNLSEIIGYFRKWVEENLKEGESIWNPDLSD